MFKPLNNRILIKPDEGAIETSNGIQLGDMSVNKDKAVTGMIALDVELFNQTKPVMLQKGNRVLFSKFGYDEVTIDKELYFVVSESNILGVFE